MGRVGACSWAGFHSQCGKGLIPLAKVMDAEDLVLLNCGVGEDSRESLGQQGDQISQS